MSLVEEDAPEYNSKVALEIVRQYQVLDEETFDLETDEEIPYDKEKLEEYIKTPTKEIVRSKRKDKYVVHNQIEKTELRRALDYVFQGNAVHYKKRIVMEGSNDG